MPPIRFAFSERVIRTPTLPSPRERGAGGRRPGEGSSGSSQIKQQKLGTASNDRHFTLVANRSAVSSVQRNAIDLHAAPSHLNPSRTIRRECVRNRAVEQRRKQRRVLMDRHRPFAAVVRRDELQHISLLVIREGLLLILGRSED